ncbi:glycosyltransferase family 4 protein [Aerococcus urinaeequi]|uniref:glycosyltransferase family 4 protein n=1 Tax=Aerococcus urinaeequi TaxID=51665 RepID=UPI003D6ACC79
MKITHIALCGNVTDGLSYQDNLLPKYHHRLGYEVSMITSKFIWDTAGGIAIDDRSEYINEYGIKTIRLENKSSLFIDKKFRRYKDLIRTLEREEPDIIFIHGVQFLDIYKVVGYLKTNKNVRVFVDNHADFSNSANNWISKNILHKQIWKRCAQYIEPYTTKFFGVLPARVDFLKEMYQLPEEKIELLVMGADDDQIKRTVERDSRSKIRNRYNIEQDTFLIVTGGKIDAAKRQILLLMESVKLLENKNIKLLVFGSVISELKKDVENLSDGNIIQYIGWISSEESYEYFSAADLVVFPGRHSVFWEQVAAQGVPMLLKWWEGTTHLDFGGNVQFLMEDSTQEIKNLIEELYKDRTKYELMQLKATSENKNIFLYSKIANKSLDFK